MDSSTRQQINRELRLKHEQYLQQIAPSDSKLTLSGNLESLRDKLKDQLRREHNSKRSLKGVCQLAKSLFGIRQHIKQLDLPMPDFDREKKIINDSAIGALDARRNSKYDGNCNYGETLLNCYLDVYITFTVPDIKRKFEAKPYFLINPRTQKNLEIDVLLEDFKLAFEFQGEHHYTDPKVQYKDSFKLCEMASQKRVLIPVNIHQLNNVYLSTLIINSIKDYLGIHNLLVTGDLNHLPNSCTNTQLMSFSKASQRMCLAQTIFEQSLVWLDNYADTYISNMYSGNPISSTTVAPRQNLVSGDLDVHYVYGKIKYVTNARKALNRE